MNISINTPFRYAAATTMSPHPLIGSQVISDIVGVTTGNNIDQIFIDIINTQTPTSTNNFNTQGMLERTLCPSVNQVNVIHSAISGSTSEPIGTIINVSIFASNGTTLLSTAQVTTTTSNWNIPLSAFSPAITLQVGQIVRTTATAPGKGTSDFACNQTTVINCTTISNFTGVTITPVSGNKGYTLVVNKPVGTIITVLNSSFQPVPTTAMTSPNNINPRTTTTSPQTFEFSCQTGNCWPPNQVYYFTIQEPGNCISPFLQNCAYNATNTSTTPSITTPILTTSNSITVSFSPTNTNTKNLSLYINNTLITTATTTNSTNYTFTGLNLSNLQCALVNVTLSDLNRCPSISANQSIVRQSTAPTITTMGCLPTPVTTISGISGETGAILELFRVATPDVSLGTATVQAGGTWSLTGLNLTSGQQIYARVNSNPTLCINQSSNSSIVTIQTRTNISSYNLSFTGDVFENNTSVSGTISGGTYPVTLRLYADEALIGNPLVVNAAGSWTISGFTSFDLAAGSTLQLTATTGSACESSLSTVNTVVKCTPPSLRDFFVERYEVCRMDSISFYVRQSELRVIYTPVYFDAVSNSYLTFGTSRIGTGNDLYLRTFPFVSSPTFLNVLAQKFPFDICQSVVAPGGDFNFTVYRTDGGAIQDSQLVIWGGNPARINEVTAGDVEGGVMSYQWQQSNDSLTGYVDIPGANSHFFDPPSGPTATTFYRRKTINTTPEIVCTEYSNVHKMTVWSALPVTLINFDVNIVDNYSLLTWSTASETNNSHFEVLHAKESSNFELIGAINSKSSNSNIKQNYSFIHYSPSIGNNYYRLKQVDNDGNFMLLPIKHVNFSNLTNFEVFPNPVSNILNIRKIKNNNVGEIILNIYNLHGKSIFKQNINYFDTNTSIDVSFLENGSYILVLETNNQTIHKKLIVIK